jgi:hypothetical protein
MQELQRRVAGENPRAILNNNMKEIIETASSLHNWKQRNGIVRDRPSRGSNPSGMRRKLETLLAASIDQSNYRTLAARAEMNSLDLIETVTRKLRTLGISGLRSAIQAHSDHGIVTCIQYLYSL